MGVKDLYKLLRKYAPNCISTLRDDQLAGWTIGIDVSLALYQWVIGASTPASATANAQDLNNHIAGALARIIKMLSVGAIPIFVFDGKPPAEKDDCRAARAKRANVIAPATAGVPANANAVPADRPCSAARLQDVAMLCKLLKIQTVQAISEADAQLARMRVDAVQTDDLDLLALGAARIIRGWTARGAAGTRGTTELIDLDRALADLQLSMPQFVDLCVLLGNDYNDRPAGFGPARALAAIRKHGSIERIMAAAGRADSPAGGKQVGKPERAFVAPARWDYERSRKLFTDPLYFAVDVNRALPAYTKQDIEAVRAFLQTKGFGNTPAGARRLTTQLNKLEKINPRGVRGGATEH